MKRENGVIKDYIAWLKSIGCRFYTPLKEDTRDYISETEGRVVGSIGGYNEHGYCFSGNTQIEFVNDFVKTITYTTKFTAILDYEKTGQSGHAVALASRPGPSSAEDHGLFFSCDASSSTVFSTGFSKNWTMICTSYPNSGQLNIWHNKTGFIYDGNGLLTRIQDGVIYDNYTKTISQSNFPFMGDNDMVIGGVKGSSGDRWRGTIGNVLLFDRELTQEELNKL